ncbi:hypothetical protein ACFLXU_02730 [Chloroflexota bacterium]
MKLPKNRQSGQTLIIVLILLALGSLLIVPGLSLASTGLNYHQEIKSNTLESYSADSGMEYIMCNLYNNPGAYTETPLDESFSLNGRTVHVTSEYLDGGIYRLTSTASSSGGGSTTIESYVNLSAGVFAWAVAGKESVTLSNASINSLPDPGDGDICSNGSIDIGGPTIVDGDASAVSTISGWEGKVTGMVSEYSTAIAFPGDYSQLYKTMAQEGGTYFGDLVITDSQSLGPLYIEGNLTVKPNVIVDLEGTVYATGTIDVQDGIFRGEHNVVAEGDIQLSGGGLTSEEVPLFTSAYGDIRMVGSLLYAVVYAPNGDVDIVNVLMLFGAVGGRTVYIGNANIYWAAQLIGREDLPGGELKTISYSYK